MNQSFPDKRPRLDVAENELEDDYDLIKKSRFSTIPAPTTVNTRDYKHDQQQHLIHDDWADNPDDYIDHDEQQHQKQAKSRIDREKLAAIRLLHQGIDLLDRDESKPESLRLEETIFTRVDGTHYQSQTERLNAFLDRRMEELKAGLHQRIPYAKEGKSFNLDVRSNLLQNSRQMKDIDDGVQQAPHQVAPILSTEDYLARRNAFYAQLDKEGQRSNPSLVAFTDQQSDDDDDDDDDGDGDGIQSTLSSRDESQHVDTPDEPAIPPSRIIEAVESCLHLCQELKMQTVDLAIAMLHKKRQDMVHAQAEIQRLQQSSTTGGAVAAPAPTSTGSGLPIRRKNVRTKPSALHASADVDNTLLIAQHQRVIDAWNASSCQTHLDLLLSHIATLTAAGYDDISSYPLESLENIRQHLTSSSS